MKTIAWTEVKPERIPVGYALLSCKANMLQWLPPDATPGGGFEQVSDVGHQMSVARRSPGLMFRGGVPHLTFPGGYPTM